MAITAFLALAGASHPAAAHGIHENSTYLESGMVHAVMTPSILLGVLAIALYYGLETSRRRDGTGPRTVHIALLALAVGLVAGLLVPERHGLEVYAFIPLAGFAAAGATYAASGFAMPWLAWPGGLLIGASMGLSGYLDGPADDQWWWFVLGIVAAVAILVVVLVTLVRWLTKRGWMTWSGIATRIAASWCAAITVLLASLLAMPPR
ncbi:MAG: hypothetical protein GC150_04730 [Rhizobiales bacterium]|nr:hypothetical protein [Hyphomicrobiales bacterium]